MADPAFDLPDMAFLSQVQIVLTVDGQQGQTTYDVIQCIVTAALNELSTANVLVPVGKNFETGEQSVTNLFGDKLMTNSHAVLTATMSGRFGATGDAWPEDPVTIFDGVIAGFAMQEAEGQIYVSVSLLHFAVALGYTSCLSSLSYPGNDSAMTFPTLFPSPAPGAGANNMNRLGGYLASDKWNATKTYSSNLWDGISQLLIAIAQTPASSIVLEKAANVVKSPNNADAIAVLNRFESTANAKSFAKTYGRPLTLNGVDTSIALAISRYLSETPALDLAGRTFWDLLISDYAANFLFQIVSLSERWLAIPGVPGLNTAPWRILKKDDLFSIEESASIQRALRAVVVATRSELNAQDGVNALQEVNSSAVYPSATKQQPGGAILLINAPPWLYSSGEALRRDTYATNGLTPPIAPPVLASATDSRATVAQNFARYIYTQEGLRGRTCSLVTFPRFDIAPGSLIQIEPLQSASGGDPFTNSLATSKTGIVTRVAVTLDASRPAGYTTIGMSFVKLADGTAETNAIDSSYSVPAHPLYGATAIYRGAPLVPEYEMPPVVPVPSGKVIQDQQLP